MSVVLPKAHVYYDVNIFPEPSRQIGTGAIFLDHKNMHYVLWRFESLLEPLIFRSSRMFRMCIRRYPANANTIIHRDR